MVEKNHSFQGQKAREKGGGVPQSSSRAPPISPTLSLYCLAFTEAKLLH